MNAEKIKAILELKVPSSVKEIQMFLGFCNFYRKFIDAYAKTTQSISSLLKKDIPFEWKKEQQDAFEALKMKIATAPILAHPDNTRPFIIETDASDFAIGCILKQRGLGGEMRTVAFYSRQMTPPETNYEIYDKELLAIFVAFKEWRHFLMGNFTTEVFCDHKNLIWFTTTKVLTRRQARWSIGQCSLASSILRLSTSLENIISRLIFCLEILISRVRIYQNMKTASRC